MFRLGYWIDYGQQTARIFDEYAWSIAKELLDIDPTLEILFLTGARHVETIRVKVELYFPRCCVQANIHGDAAIQFHQARLCDVWCFPYPVVSAPLEIPTIVCVPDCFANDILSFQMPKWVEASRPSCQKFICSSPICVAFSVSTGKILQEIYYLPPAQTRIVDLTKVDGPSEFLSICKEAFLICQLSKSERIARSARSWSDQRVETSKPSGPPNIFLFLPTIYPGGVWQASKDLVFDLIDINEEQKQLSLSFGLPDDQGDHETIKQIGKRINLDRFELAPITDREARKRTGEVHGRNCKLTGLFSFMKGCEKLALQADAWFALTDRFRHPIWPIRPYGVLVFDMIQRHVPEAFPEQFFDWVEFGIKPTIENSDFVITASDSTRKDVLATYNVNADKVKMVPIATNPGQRFRGMAPKTVALPRSPFILQVTNRAPHKGIHLMFRGYSKLKKRMGRSTPLLVICGFGTELFSSKSKEQVMEKYIIETRKLFTDLGLEEYNDVVFLGFVEDCQLLDLYYRSAIVVNAAKYDLGTLCAIEARYFGKPVVSSRYPAIEEMAQRYSLPIHFFAIEHEESLAKMMEAALCETSLKGSELLQVQKGMEGGQLSHRHFAGEVYKLLVDLGQRARRERLALRPDQM